jgi:hypothetical protein
MRKRYYRVTGLNCGIPIKPILVTEDFLDDVLVEWGDSCRDYEEITEQEYRESIQREINEIKKRKPSPRTKRIVLQMRKNQAQRVSRLVVKIKGGK